MKIFKILSVYLLTFLGVSAQTLNVSKGNVVYSFSAEQTGIMNYSQGKEVTIQGKTFTLSDLTGMTVDDTTVPDNTVIITYKENSA